MLDRLKILGNLEKTFSKENTSIISALDVDLKKRRKQSNRCWKEASLNVKLKYWSNFVVLHLNAVAFLCITHWNLSSRLRFWRNSFFESVPYWWSVRFWDRLGMGWRFTGGSNIFGILRHHWCGWGMFDMGLDESSSSR